MEMGKTLEELWKSCYGCLEFVWEYYSLDISWLSWYIDHGSFRKPSNSPSERKLLQAIAWLSQLSELKNWRNGGRKWRGTVGNVWRNIGKKRDFWASKMVEDADFSKHAKELGFSHCRKWTFTNGYWNWVCLKMVKTELKMRFGNHDVPGWNVAQLMEIGYPLIRNVRGHLKLTEQAQNEARRVRKNNATAVEHHWNNIALSTLSMVIHQNSSWKPWLPNRYVRQCSTTRGLHAAGDSHHQQESGERLSRRATGASMVRKGHHLGWDVYHQRVQDFAGPSTVVSEVRFVKTGLSGSFWDRNLFWRYLLDWKSSHFFLWPFLTPWSQHWKMSSDPMPRGNGDRLASTGGCCTGSMPKKRHMKKGS